MTKVVLLRGSAVNPWELRSWGRLGDGYEVEVVAPRSNLHDLSALGIAVRAVHSPTDRLPTAFRQRLGNNAGHYRGLRTELAGADVIHAAEISSWFSAQAARSLSGSNARLVLTVWETLPLGGALRSAIGRRRRLVTLPVADHFAATTERARLALTLEGVPAERVSVVEPGIDTARFGVPADPPGAEVVVLTVARLVWEKGVQDLIRAVRVLHDRGERRVRLDIVGEGPERTRLEAYVTELGLAAHVRFLGSIAYDELPATYARASAFALASLPVARWDEQFGMVLAEAMAAGLPIVATACGAVPEVLGGHRPETGVWLVAPGDWPGLADALAAGPLALVPGSRFDHGERTRRFSVDAAASRLAALYDRVLSAPPRALDG